MTLPELEARRALLLERCLRTDAPELWMDLQGLDEAIRQRRADQRLVEFHRAHYGPGEGDAILLGEFDAPLSEDTPQ